MVELIQYDKENPKHLPLLHFMLESQSYLGITDIANDSLPAIGFVAIESGKAYRVPVAAGFLRRVEGGFAQLDTLMSNAMRPAEIRHEAISMVVEELISEAKKLNLHGILATSKDESTIMRALALGFHVVEEQKLIALPLKEPKKHV